MNRSRASPIEERKEVSDTNIGNSVEEENAVHRTMSPPPYDQKKSLAATGGTEYMRNSKDETSQNNPNNVTNALGIPSGVAISGEMGSAQDEKNKGKFQGKAPMKQSREKAMNNSRGNCHGTILKYITSPFRPF